MASASATPPGAAVTRDGDVLTLALSGQWRLRDPSRPFWAPPPQMAGARRLVVTDAGLSRWDSSAALYLVDAGLWCARQGVELDLGALPPELRELAALARQALQEPPAPAPPRPRGVTRLGVDAQRLVAATRSAAEFMGECALGLASALRRPRGLRRDDWLLHVQQAGPEALPIISLMAFLVGTILAYQSALQLTRFGAETLIVNLVDLSVTRELGPIMVAVVLSGRTAAAYAAELGSMAVGEELDALETAGVSPVEFLVVPRLLALAIVTPLLTVYADFVAVLGGTAVAWSMVRVSPLAFYVASKQALNWHDVRMGLLKSAVFGLIVGVCGCLRGLRARRDTAGVGQAATSAVVTSILWVVLADSILGKFFALTGF